MKIQKTIRNMFSNKRLEKAFGAVKSDMNLLEDKHNALKHSADEWIMFLDQENRQLKMRVRELEKKLDSREETSFKSRFSVLKNV